MRTETSSSCSTLVLTVNKAAIKKLHEIEAIENVPTVKILERLIMSYTPVPAILKEGEFKSIPSSSVNILKKIKPYAIVVSLFWNKKIGIDFKIWKDMREGRMSKEEFQRTYIEKLMLPAAQEEIKRLKKLKTTNDVYITSWEGNAEFTMRQIFLDFVSGKLVWK